MEIQRSNGVPTWFDNANALLRGLKEKGGASAPSDLVSLGSTMAPPAGRPAFAAQASEPTAVSEPAATSTPSVGIHVVNGDITRVPADGLVTAINSEGMWFGGIDGAIQRVAGGQFHEQAAAAQPLTDNQTVVARGTGGANHGAFKNVVFVVDDLNKPLRQVVKAGLQAADRAGFGSVSLPAMRMGVMQGVVEKSPREVASEMAAGVQAFLADHPQHLRDITFVVYNDPATASLLQQAMPQAR